jgi:cell division protease FtsH
MRSSPAFREWEPSSPGSGRRRDGASFSSDSSRGVSFDDVTGVDEAVTELREVADFLKNRERYTKVGARIPKGVLLVELDGFDATVGVIIMAATNRPDLLDPALQRPGRFDRQVVVDRPDLKGREAILAIHAKRVQLEPDVDLRVVAARTPGFAGAQLANVVNEAALLAVRSNRDKVSMKDLDEAIDRVMAGLERSSRALIPREKEIVAHHEMGHALVSILLPNTDPVHKVSIVPRGATTLGTTVQTPLED